MSQAHLRAGTGVRRLLLALLWLGLLVLLGWQALGRLEISGDLRLFMPAPRTDEQRLLLQQFGEGPGARLLLVALAGASPEQLAERSRSMQALLGADATFRIVANGEADLDAIPEQLLAYRYLLSPRATQQLQHDALRAALLHRTRDLASPAAALVEQWIARDPTLETLALLERWQPPHAPERRFGVWFSADASRALLLVETAAPGFDPDAQQQALERIRAAFAQAVAEQQAAAPDEGPRSDAAAAPATASATPSTRIAAQAAAPDLEVSGPGAFSVLMRARTQGEAGTLGAIASIALVLLLAFAYRNMAIPVLGALPLASAALAGLAMVAVLFGSVHGITLAFGFTLIGVAQDYPVHLFSNHLPGVPARRSVRQLWRTLATGMASTCIAFLGFFAAGVEGLAQLATFTITGLATAALATRYLLPALLPDARRDPADGALVRRVATALQRLPRPRAALAAVALAALAVLALAPHPWWENSLAALTPVPTQLLERDRLLRAELGAPDVRHVLVIEAPAAADDPDAALQAVLERSEQLDPALQQLVARGAIDGYDLAARYLPSAATQLRRQAQLPAAEQLEASLHAALQGLGFRAGVFAPFLADVQRARSIAPLTPDDLDGTPLAARVSGLLARSNAAPVALVTLTGVADAAALRAFAEAAGADVHLLDLRAASEALAAAWRERVVLAMLAALVLLLAAVWLALRRPGRVLRVVAPMLLTTLLVLALLHGTGVPLTLFHLVALMLGAGLGLDYALFVDHAGTDARAQRRTLHALMLCAASTLLVFALLALSQIPVLRAIGVTVALCVLCNLVLALLLARPAATAAMATA